jgi:hypothetical protein
MDLFQLALLVAPVVASVQAAIMARDARRTMLWSALAGGVAAAVFIGYAILRFVRGTPPLLTALVFLIGMAIGSGMLGWFIFRLRLIFQSEQPWLVARQLVYLLLGWSLKIGAALVVASGFAQAVLIDLADEPAEIVYYRLEYNLHWLRFDAAAASLIVLVSSYLYTRPNNSTYTPTWRFALFGIAPPVVTCALMLPILIAWVEALLAAPMLDCTPTNVPGYFPDMVDYTWLVLDNLAKGAMLGFGQPFGFNLSKCVADASNSIAVSLAWVLRLAPGCIVVWLGTRRYLLGV